jgi:hypothetical protein
VFEKVAAPIVDGCLEGFNGAILGYGQTGSGKTHSLRGDQFLGIAHESGIVPRAFARLLDARESLRSAGVDISLSVSCCQLYCEMIHDILDPSRRNLSIRECRGDVGSGGVFVQGLSSVPLTDLAQGLELLQSADAHRTVAATALNATSSRSHAVYLVRVERRAPAGADGVGREMLSATLTLVDLAGSERVKRSGAMYQQLEESKVSAFQRVRCPLALVSTTAPSHSMWWT